ncbi:MAG TPA: phosphatase PAP2 family protein, partial [Gaiellaceae bacterium]|nr:phosphatase PAP2 family protein [Gaiellaceae bacterium]
MSTAVAAGRRVLPRGYIDLLRQAAIWFGFLFAYQFARGLADRDPSKAFTNGWRVLDFEQRVTHHVFELTLQQLADSSSLLKELVAWTYWNSEFTVVGLALLWVYLRRNDAFIRFRNTVLLANVLGLIGYVLLPTAPPRMFPSLGFLDTLDSFGGLN